MDSAARRFHFRPAGESSFRGALLVVAVPPTPGFVARVCGEHLVESAGLEYAGAFVSEALPAAVVARAGLALPGLRVHLGRQRCGLDGRCDQLAVLMADHAIPTELHGALAGAVAEWAAGEGVGAIIVLDGMPRAAEAVAPARILGVGSTPEALRLLVANGVERLDGVTLHGLTGALLAEGVERDFPVTTLVVEARGEFRDAGAAAILLEAVAKYVLQLDIDPAPLQARAKSLTERAQAASRRNLDASDAAFMYG